MNVLIIVHVESEGPGTLGVFLVSTGATLHMARLYAGDSVPESIDGLDAVVSMGGPMNVYEEEKYPFLKHETALLRNAIDAGRPVLGVCLGAQMIAKACGARVVKSPKKEVGWGQIFVTDAGKEDVLFTGLPPTLEVLQWHEDMFEIPEAGSLIATGNDCPHQAFRYRNAFGLQFHVEVTRDILADWFKDSPDLGIILRRYEELKRDLDRNAERVYRNFLGLIR